MVYLTSILLIVLQAKGHSGSQEGGEVKKITTSLSEERDRILCKREGGFENQQYHPYVIKNGPQARELRYV